MQNKITPAWAWVWGSDSVAATTSVEILSVHFVTVASDTTTSIASVASVV